MQFKYYTLFADTAVLANMKNTVRAEISKYMFAGWPPYILRSFLCSVRGPGADVKKEIGFLRMMDFLWKIAGITEGYGPPYPNYYIDLLGNLGL